MPVEDGGDRPGPRARTALPQWRPDLSSPFEYPNGPAWKVNIGDGDNRADANGAAGVSDGQWHTLSCSFDRDGSMRLYTDGVFSAEEDIGGIGNLDVGEGWYFGSDIDGGYSYTGAIAEVRFWHGVLDDATILDWHCSALTEAHPRVGGASRALAAHRGRWHGHRLCSKRRAHGHGRWNVVASPRIADCLRLQQHPAHRGRGRDGPGPHVRNHRPRLEPRWHFVGGRVQQRRRF